MYISDISKCNLQWSQVVIHHRYHFYPRLASDKVPLVESRGLLGLAEAAGRRRVGGGAVSGSRSRHRQRWRRGTAAPAPSTCNYACKDARRRRRQMRPALQRLQRAARTAAACSGGFMRGPAAGSAPLRST